MAARMRGLYRGSGPPSKGAAPLSETGVELRPANQALSKCVKEGAKFWRDNVFVGIRAARDVRPGLPCGSMVVPGLCHRDTSGN